MSISPSDLETISDFSVLARLFYDELGWPQRTWATFEGAADLYDIPPEDIEGVKALSAVRMLEPGQTWGIFQVDFGSNKLRRSQLRAILNRVADKARRRHDNPVWPHGDILFVCRSETTTWTLGHYSGDKPATAKLKTFGWSDPLSARTFLTRNLPRLKWSEQQNWAKAWDAEALTTEFYKQYDRVFTLVEQRTQHPKNAETKRLFVQGLFNRLMFLAFIERMGWLEVSGEKDYLHTLFQRHKAAPDRDAPTFYHVLELLFFSGLNSVNGIGGGHQLSPILGKVPYLNGGLFQRDPETEPAGVTVPDEVFEEIFGDPDGLFRRYTFTVTESTPLDVDVAVDPEMLGKIFEELVTGRHESGSYYTPRPVVSFMCREALKRYLTENGIDAGKAEALVDNHHAEDLKHGEISDILLLLGAIKVVDPACGSGAYLLGMMRELFDLIQIVERRRLEAGPRELYQVKLDIIQNNLYGVDIDPFAVNIARLRLWLSLAVDRTGGDPEPLPNLDYKIETGDSLIAPNPAALRGTTDMFREASIRLFDQLKKEYGRPAVTQDDARRKLELRKEIDQLRSQLAQGYSVDEQPVEGGLDWRVEFAEVFQDRQEAATFGGPFNLGPEAGRAGQAEFADPPKPPGFDIVLANPPYVRADAQFSHLLPDKTAQQSAIHGWKAYRDRIKTSRQYETLYEKWDLFIPFLERAHQILAPGGQMVFIIPDAYNGNKYAEKSHAFFLVQSQIERIDFCSDIPLFRAGVFNTILHFSKQVPASGHAPVRARRWGGEPGDFETNCELFPAVPQSEARERVFRPVAERNAALRPGYLPLMQLFYISKGAVLHADEKAAQGAFKLDDLISEVEDPLHTKKLFLGKNMGTWTVVGNSWLEYGTARAPALFSRKTFPELYEVPAKLVTMDLSGDSLRVIFDDRQCWHNHSAWSLVPWHSLKGVHNRSLLKSARYSSEKRGAAALAVPREQLEDLSESFDIRYVLGLMNSREARVWMARQRRNKMHIYPDDWKQFPVKVADKRTQGAVSTIVQRILNAKQADHTAGVQGDEEALDELVHFIYNDQQSDETLDDWKNRVAAEAATEVGAARSLMKSGEDDKTEFKSSIIWNVRADRHDLLMRDEVLKETCAFLNADGGTILCGVDDDGNLLGLEKDIKHAGGKDKLGLVITNALGDLLKPNPVELVKQKFIEIDGETILRIDVTPDRKHRYESPSTKKEDAGKNIPRTHVRIHGSAKALEGQDLINWWERRQDGSGGSPSGRES